MILAHLLVVDDDDRLRTLFATYLTRQGYRVSQAGDGLDALLRLRQEPVDLLITDVNMPRLDGLGLVRRIRMGADTAQIPIILFSGVIDDDEARRAIDAGVDVYLDKSGDLKQLAAAVARLLPMRPTMPEVDRSRSDPMSTE